MDIQLALICLDYLESHMQPWKTNILLMVQKSGQPVDAVDIPAIHKVLYIPGGGGFLNHQHGNLEEGIPFGKQYFQGPFYFSAGRYQHLGGLAACFLLG